MRPLYGLAWGWALALLAIGGTPAQAAWNNVFQVCCNHCGKSSPAPAVSGYVAGYAGDSGCPTPCQPACPPPPTTTCTTRYVQRSFYQPVTSYRTSYYYEPVTTYRTSYYYEPVTSYRYSCYYDPCTCSYQSVACPTTSYRLRERCCPVTSYLQRTCMTPVTSYQQSFYYEPVTSCCTSTTGAAVAAPPAGAVASPPPATSESTSPPPGTTASPPPPPVTTESTSPGLTSDSYKMDRSPPVQSRPTMPPASYQPTPARTPTIRFDRIASRGNANLEGKVVLRDSSPRSNARLLLVSADEKSVQKTIQTDRDGSFRTKVEAGGWLVYSQDESGRPTFVRRIEVPADRLFTLTVTQR
ncbi:MAG: hypothetical protein U0840_27200 [Gemmataceae bacterium]